MRIASNNDKESVYQLRKDLRTNFIDHNRYKPEIDTFLAQRLYRGIYNVNEKEDPHKVYQSLSDYIT